MTSKRSRPLWSTRVVLEFHSFTIRLSGFKIQLSGFTILVSQSVCSVSQSVCSVSKSDCAVSQSQFQNPSAQFQNPTVWFHNPTLTMPHTQKIKQNTTGGQKSGSNGIKVAKVVVDCCGFSYQTETLEARSSLAPWTLGLVI